MLVVPVMPVKPCKLTKLAKPADWLNRIYAKANDSSGMSIAARCPLIIALALPLDKERTLVMKNSAEATLPW
jgi:hypothetical protein